MCSVEESRLSGRHLWASGVVLIAVLIGCGGRERQPPASDTVVPGAPPAADPATVAAAPGVPAGGEQLFQRCVTCHQANGQGLPSAFPPLAGSEFATAANPAVPISVVLHGLQGPITVKGSQYNSVMPAYGTGVAMSDEEVASVLTYVRQAWGNGASAVTPEEVAKVRAAKRAATGPVTAEELKALM